MTSQSHSQSAWRKMIVDTLSAEHFSELEKDQLVLAVLMHYEVSAKTVEEFIYRFFVLPGKVKDIGGVLKRG